MPQVELYKYLREIERIRDIREPIECSKKIESFYKSYDVIPESDLKDNILSKLVNVLINKILYHFKDTFPVDTNINIIEKLLLEPKDIVLSTIVSSLDKEGKYYSALYIKKWVKNQIFYKAIEKYRSNKERYKGLISLIFSIPDKISNAFNKDNIGHDHIKISNSLKKTGFFQKLADSIKEYDELLISKYCVLDMADVIWSHDFKETELAELTLNLPTSSCSPFLLSMLDMKEPEFSKAVLSVLFSTNERIKYLISNYYITKKLISDKAFNTIMEFLVGQGLANETIEVVGKIWSRHTSVALMETELHSQLSRVILKMLDHTTKEQLENSEAVKLIINGVTAHIGLVREKSRKLGLMVGEKITSIILPEHPLKFDELHQDEEKEENDPLSRFNTEPPPINVLNGVNKAKEKEKSKSGDTINIFGEWNDGIENDDSDDSDSDPFIPYKIEDNVGIDGTVVYYPSNIVKLFQTDENDSDRYKKWQTGISNAKGAVEVMTDNEAKSTGADFLRTLLSVENEYNMDEFEDLRREAIVKLMTRFPEEGCNLVIKEISNSKSYSLSRKITLMACIAYAAVELAELPKPKRNDIIEGHMLRLKDPAKTRRWGSALHKISHVKMENKFNPQAKKYFYAIINSITFERLLKDEDGLEISQVLTTLAVIVEASATSLIDIDQMCDDLIYICRLLMSVKPPNGRKALAFAISCSLIAHKSFNLTREFSEELERFIENEPDDNIKSILIAGISAFNDRITEENMVFQSI